MNAAAAHAAFVMTVSTARMCWLLRHAQHARDINIHKFHPLPEKKSAWALPIFCTVEPVTLKKPCVFHPNFNHDFDHDFLSAQWNTPITQRGAVWNRPKRGWVNIVSLTCRSNIPVSWTVNHHRIVYT